jgi:hypothetical protein
MNVKKLEPVLRSAIRVLLFLGALIFSGPLSAQNIVAPNSLVKEAIPESEIVAITAADPYGMLYYNYLTEQGWFLMDIPTEKSMDAESYPFLFKIDRNTKTVLPEKFADVNISGFNLLNYDYKISTSRNYYRIVNSNQLLVIKSHSEITAGINQIKN